LYFVASVAMIWLGARWWDSRGYQRYFTVGIRAVWGTERASDGALVSRWTRRAASKLALD
jgi:uncharacterized membrane protein